MKELAYLFEGVTTVEVTFQETKTQSEKGYTYKCLKSDLLKPGDMTRYVEQCKQARDEFIASLPIDGLKALGVAVDE